MVSMAEKIFGGGGGWLPDWRNLFNAAFVATAAAVAMSLMGLQDVVPQVIYRPLKLIGDSTIPLSMVIVGGIMVVHFSKNAVFRTGFVLKVAALKLAVLPLLIFAAIEILKGYTGVHISPALEFLLVLEGMMPPAATLPLLAGKHDGDYILVGQALFGVTLLSLLTVPVLLTVLRVVP